MIVIGHRGAPSLAHENTLESFNLALLNNVDGLEFDVQLTKDHKYVVYHDYNILYQNKQYEISQLLLSEIKAMDLGFIIPTFDEVLNICSPDKIINVEIKAKNIIHHKLIDQVIYKIKNHHLTSSTIVSSFNPFVLLELKKQNSEIKRGQLWSISPKEPWYVSYLSKSLLEPYSFHANVKYITPPISSWLKKENIKLFLYTVNNQKQLSVAKSVNADGIFSDYPQILDSIKDNNSV